MLALVPDQGTASAVTVFPARAVCAVRSDECVYVPPATRDDRGAEHAVVAVRTGGRRVCGVWLPDTATNSLQGPSRDDAEIEVDLLYMGM